MKIYLSFNVQRLRRTVVMTYHRWVSLELNSNLWSYSDVMRYLKRFILKDKHIFMKIVKREVEESKDT